MKSYFVNWMFGFFLIENGEFIIKSKTKFVFI